MLQLTSLLFRVTPIRSTIVAICSAVSVFGMLVVLLAIRNLASSDELRPGMMTLLGVGIAAALVARVAAQWTSLDASKRAMRTLSREWSERLLATSAVAIERAGVRALQSATLVDMPAVVQALSGLPTIAASAAILAACLTILVSLAPPVAAILVGWLLVEAIAIGAAVAMLKDRHESAGPASGAAAAEFRRLIEGFKDLKMRRTLRASFLDEALTPAVESQHDRRTYERKTQIVSEGAGRIGFLIAVGVTILVLPRIGVIDLTVAATSVVVLLIAARPLESLRQQIPVVVKGRASLHRWRRLEAALSDDAESRSPERWPVSDWKAIAFDDLTVVRAAESCDRDSEMDADEAMSEEDDVGEFDFGGDRRSAAPASGGDRGSASEAVMPRRLGPWSLELRRGETIVLRTSSSEVSARFARLVAGVDPPSSGLVRVDGRNVAAENRDDYRQLFTAVFADSRSFTDIQPVRITSLESTVRNWLGPLRLDGKVGLEGGTIRPLRRLTSSERRRATILEAILDDRSAYVIDGWSDDQPGPVADVLRETILPDLQARGKTIVILTKSSDAFPRADRIARLDATSLVIDRDDRVLDSSSTDAASSLDELDPAASAARSSRAPSATTDSL